jgi:sec-independent protein translocase protein TatA
MKIGPWEVGLILLIVLLIFGSGKIAGLGKTLGKAVRGFKEEVSVKPEKGQTGKTSITQEPPAETSTVKTASHTPEVSSTSKT